MLARGSLHNCCVPVALVLDCAAVNGSDAVRGGKVALGEPLWLAARYLFWVCALAYGGAFVGLLR